MADITIGEFVSAMKIFYVVNLEGKKINQCKYCEEATLILSFPKQNRCEPFLEAPSFLRGCPRSILF
jgi:hypothetical protein